MRYRVMCDDLALTQNQNRVTNLLHHFQDVGTVQDDLFLLSERLEQATQQHGEIDVEAGERLVQDEQFGVVQ